MSNLFFHPQEDILMIRPGYRDHSELAFWAEEVERYVIDEYTQEYDSDDYAGSYYSDIGEYKAAGDVKLDFYKEDPSEVTNPAFKKAFKRLVAHILNHGILPNLDKEEHLEAFKSGKRSWQYADSYGELDFWPEGSTRFLKTYDTRTPRYYL